jgi:VTC domain
MSRGVIEPEHASVPLDRAMTADRDEIKFVVAHQHVRSLLQTLSRELSPHHFSGEGANLLPDAEHYSTTVYFDTASRALYRAARDNPADNSKLRAREYYDVHSSLAELATSPEQIVRHQPWLFFELKRRAGARTFKHRVRLHKTEVAECFRDNAFERAATLEDSAAERADRTALATFCAGLSDPLVPSCVVNYRRLAFQDPSAALRVTIDLDVTYYLPPDALWSAPHALLRGRCGRPVGALRGCLAEVKARGEQPAWLERALAAAQATPEAFSKFNAASEAVALAADKARTVEAARP